MKIYVLGFLLILGIIQASARHFKILGYNVDFENSFAQNFSSAVYSYNNNTNVVCSPLSSYLLLAQVQYLTHGNTAQQLRNALALPKNSFYSVESFQSVQEKLQGINDVQLYTASRIIIYKDLKVNEDFSNLMKRIFDSEIKSFNGSAAALANDVNSWVDSKTNHKINKVINPDDIDEKTTKLILLNAVYFNAAWLNPFSYKSVNGTFYDLNKNLHWVPMMVLQAKSLVWGYVYLDDTDAVYFELPYKNRDFKMVIIAPRMGEWGYTGQITEAEFNKLGDKLKKFSYKNLPKSKQSSETKVYLPKFKIESLINLEPVLKAMNADEMFTDKAHFKKLSKNQNVDLQITKIFQKVVINVTEGGTEAPATELPSFDRLIAIDYIYVYTPFYFLIESSQGTLFQGRVYFPHYE